MPRPFAVRATNACEPILCFPRSCHLCPHVTSRFFVRTTTRFLSIFQKRAGLHEIVGAPFLNRLRRYGLRNAQMKQLQECISQPRLGNDTRSSSSSGRLGLRKGRQHVAASPGSHGATSLSANKPTVEQKGESGDGAWARGLLREMDRAVTALGKADWNDRAVGLNRLSRLVTDGLCAVPAFLDLAISSGLRDALSDQLADPVSAASAWHIFSVVIPTCAPTWCGNMCAAVFHRQGNLQIDFRIV
eukprot:SAG31_NODE_1179_length_9530_cov_8.153748_5_plen_245_part_00